MGKEKARALSEHRALLQQKGETQLMGQPQVLSGKSQCKHEHGKQKQEVEGLDHLQTCSDTLALPGCRGITMLTCVVWWGWGELERKCIAKLARIKLIQV